MLTHEIPHAARWAGWWHKWFLDSPPLRWPLPQVTSSPPVLPSCQPLHVTRALPPPPKSTGAPFACTPHPSYVVCARQDPWKGPRSPNKCACQHLRRPGIRAGLEAVPVEVEAAVEGSSMVIGVGDCSGAHCTIVAGPPEEKSLPPARLGLRGG